MQPVSPCRVGIIWGWMVLLVFFGCASTQRSVAPCGSGTEPERVVCAFYAAYLEDVPVGLPTAEQRQRLAPHLTPALLERFDAARAAQRAFEVEHPGEKPPFADGSLFTSLFEGADRFEIVGSESGPDGGAAVTVRFGYQDAPPWEDTVIVVREGTRYAIDDIVFSGAGEFNPPGRLTEILQRRE